MNAEWLEVDFLRGQQGAVDVLGELILWTERGQFCQHINQICLSVPALN